MIVFVAGCRPNFVKMAPLMKQFQDNKIPFLFCHTGQHYDDLMSKVFIEEFNLPEPDFYGIENIPAEAEYVIVFGDVNSSREAAEYAYEKGIKIIHIESGLRSFDKTMPEELNRIRIDEISDYCFVTESDGIENLSYQVPVKERKTFLVGNTMIDSLAKTESRFILLTLHRPSNVDNPEKLKLILQTIDSLGIRTFFPVHPRVKIAFEIELENIIRSFPYNYKIFIRTMRNAALIITDSGGVQEEAAWLGRKCLTLRDNTERPITLKYGNELITVEKLAERVKELMEIPLWDGKAAERIFEIMKSEKII